MIHGKNFLSNYLVFSLVWRLTRPHLVSLTTQSHHHMIDSNILSRLTGREFVSENHERSEPEALLYSSLLCYFALHLYSFSIDKWAKRKCDGKQIRKRQGWGDWGGFFATCSQDRPLAGGSQVCPMEPPERVAKRISANMGRYVGAVAAGEV